MNDLREGIMADDLNDRLKKRVALQKVISLINSQTNCPNVDYHEDYKSNITR